MNLCTSFFVYIGSIGLYKRIVNADTQSIRIANADGQKKLKKLSLLKGDENFFPRKVRRGFFTHPTAITPATRGKPLRLQSKL